MTGGSRAWVWMAILGLSLLIVPIQYTGITGDTLLILFTSVIGAKWLIFAIMHWSTNTRTGERLLEWTAKRYIDEED